MPVDGTAAGFPRPPQFHIPLQLAIMELAGELWSHPLSVVDDVPSSCGSPSFLATARLQGLSQGLHTFC